MNLVGKGSLEIVEPGKGVIMWAGAEPLTTRKAVVDCAMVPLLAVIVNEYEPRGMDAEVTMFNPEAPEPESVAGLK